MSEYALQATGLGKRYVLGAVRKGHLSFREALTERVASAFRKSSPVAAQREFWALRDAQFDIEHGENVGIVGLNGAGKSTLLKILARITEPTSGRVRIEGRVGALLEVGTGFHPELTGRENVYLYGSILGMRHQEVRRKFDAIIAFSGIEPFVDTPVKRYSSGMYVRLAFAVAAHLDPDILLLDEVLAVGDLAFQRKCFEHARALQKRQATILFVSHNMFSIKTMCNRVLYLRNGRLEFDGQTDAGIEIYEKDCRLSTLGWTESDPAQWPVRLTGCDLIGETGAAQTVFDFGERMTLHLTYETRETVDQPNFIVAFIRSDGVACCNYSSEADGVSLRTLDRTGVIEVQTPPLKLVAESYTVSVLIRENGFQRVLCAQMGGAFHMRHPLYNTHFGVFHEPATWRTHAHQQYHINRTITSHGKHG